MRMGKKPKAFNLPVANREHKACDGAAFEEMRK
jgi:hypothetical protein